MKAENQRNNGRNRTVDLVRGFAVFATLLAHANQRSLTITKGVLYPANFLTKLIYPWYMTSFVMASGYVLGMKGSFCLWRKFKHLIIPTYVWSFVLYLIHEFDFVGIKWYFDFFKYSPVEYIKMLLVNPTYVIWFLWTIFVMTLIVWICRLISVAIWQGGLSAFTANTVKQERKGFYYWHEPGKTLMNVSELNFYTCISCILAFSLISRLQLNQQPGLHFVAHYWIYFFLGYTVGVFCDTKRQLKRFALVGLSILIVTWLLNKYEILQVDDGYLEAFIGIDIVYLISSFIAERYQNSAIKALIWMGQNSLPIYIFQLAFLGLGFGSGYIRFITTFLMTTCCAICMTIIVKRYKLLRALLLGDF